MLHIISVLKGRFKFLRSLKIQLFIALFLAAMIPVLFVSRLMIETYQSDAIENRVSELQEKGAIISNLLVSSNYFSGVSAIDTEDTEGEIELIAEAYRGRIVLVNKDLKIVKDTYGLEDGKTLISEQVINCYNGGTSSKYVDKENEYIELIMPIVNASTKEQIGIMIMSFSSQSIYAVYDSIAQAGNVICMVVCVLAVVVAFLYARRVTKPFARISNLIDHATDGFLNESVSVKGYTEMENISESVNRLLTRLQKLEDSRQEFVSNVSHELKTPITSIKVLSESLMMQEDVPVELYREFMADITEEIERENKIINDLLSLVKLDKTSGDLNISPVNVNELLEQILKRLRPIAEKRNIEMVFESFRQVTAEVDEVKISLAINNLIENAIKYNYDDGWVRVSLNADHKYFYITVADSGVGIPEDVQDNIFERFYRVDKARSRETGGTGLGLSITRNAILMHRGSIKVYSKENEGATFTIRVPLTFIA